MFVFSILLFLTGAVFAWRFRVFSIALMSVCVFFGALVLLIGMHSLFPAAAYAFMLCAMPQLGYFFGLAARLSLASQRIPQDIKSRKIASRANLQ